MGDEAVLLVNLTKAPALYLVASAGADGDSWEIGISTGNVELPAPSSSKPTTKWHQSREERREQFHSVRGRQNASVSVTGRDEFGAAVPR